MPQPVEFQVGRPPAPVAPVTVSARDAERLVRALRARDEASALAGKIEAAMELGASDAVEPRIGEDEELLAGLADLRAEGDFGRELERLERALRAKIDAES